MTRAIEACHGRRARARAADLRARGRDDRARRGLPRVGRRGPRVPRLRRRDRGRRARPPAPAPSRRRARAARPALARVESLLDGADAPARGAALGAVRRRAGVLLQLGRRGERGGAQGRAQGDRPHADRRARGRLPRPDARRALRHRPAGEVGGLRAARPRGLASRGRTTSSRSRRRSRRAASSRRSCSSRCSARAACSRSRRASSRPRRRSRARSARSSASTRCRPGSAGPGTFFAFEQLGIEPDLVTLAKGLGNGLPIGALLVRRRHRRRDRPGRPRLDVRRQPRRLRPPRAPSCEAIDDALLANVAARGAQLAAGLARLPGVLEVRGRGLLLAAVLDRDAAPVVDACRDAGSSCSRPAPDVLRLLPPLVVTRGGGRPRRSRVLAEVLA